jgi:hypothetical protein
MSDVPGAAGGDTVGLPTNIAPSDADIAKGIEGLLDAEAPRRRRAQPAAEPAPADTPSDAEEASDPGPDPLPTEEEDPSPGDEDDEGIDPDEPEEEPAPAIDPPQSWKADEKTAWAKLPPDVQAIVARREGERDRYISTRSQEMAEERRASAEARLSERGEYKQNLEKLLFVAAPEAEKFTQIDWQRLAAENPADYVRLTAERDALRGRIASIQGEIQRIDYQSNAEREQQFGQFRQEQAQLLAAKLPVYADAERGPKFVRELTDYLQTQGFTPQELAAVVDHRAIILAEKAMRADRAAAARNGANTQKAPPPRVQQPGTKQRSDTSAGQRRNNKLAALERSGSEKDAVAYLLEIL